MDCKNFLLKSKSPTSFTPYCYHWLPENQAELLPSPLPVDVSDTKNLPEYYEKFNKVDFILNFAGIRF